MQVSSQMNNYQDLNTNNKLVTIQPVPEEGKKNPDIEVSPEKRLDVENSIDDKQTQAAVESQEKRDQQRGVLVDHVERQSKKTQVEIYLAVATDSKVEIGGNDTIDSINTLRDIQKQNNAVAGHETYKANQNGNIETQFGV
ncbi:MAG: hypothetical protein DRG78_23370 [Epsilonproteobacteria bacterium]|nr:MAG: hypothetical protein DRG78_23370 [Campylobacterota bacterium]